MRGILVFNHLNDVLFSKCDKKFVRHIKKLAKTQGLLSESEDEEDTSDSPSANIIMQLFSPIVTSQQIMSSQFGNSYTSMKCEDGTNMVFDEFMGNTFIYISTKEVDLMKRILGIFISITRLICGPDVSSLKTSTQKTNLVSSLLDAWMHLRETEQSFLTEAVEQLSVNIDLASSTLKVLMDAADKLKAQSEFSNIHLLILVEQKFLSLFSSKNAQDLNASDTMMIILMCYVANKRESSENKEIQERDILLRPNSSIIKNEDLTSTSSSLLSNPTSEDIQNLFGDSRYSSVNEDLYTFAEDGLYSQLVLLGSNENFTANAIHISKLAEGINLVTIVEVMNLEISCGLYDSFYHLDIINKLQLQRDMDDLRSAVENLESSIKKTIDGIKKHRAYINNDIDLCQRRLQVKWEFVRKKYIELFKSRDPDYIVKVESNISGFIETLRELFRLTCFDKNLLKQGFDVIGTVSRLVSQKLNDFSDFLKVKALKNFSLGSRTSLTINKYLEEFPGLVHFIYIDRTNHRLTAPTVDFTNSETLQLTTAKIWTMIEESRIHLQEGHMSVMWKDTTFNYAYFLWFEDSSGTPLKNKEYVNHTIKSFGVPGILCGDYYRKIASAYYPKISPNKMRIYELYCVHLGLATASCVLEHSRRLAATIWEVTGLPNNPVDIL